VQKGKAKKFRRKENAPVFVVVMSGYEPMLRMGPVSSELDSSLDYLASTILINIHTVQSEWLTV
jgi:hypothetical protein